jgi:8-oxo-dGTP pyrophosphatase MutT (NUDIX family)
MNNHIKKFNPCLNCGKFGHEQRQCREPIKSWGIILVKFDDKVNHSCTNIKKYENFNGIRLYSKDDLMKASEIMEKIKFLLVRRKHSLGFSEFIRGKYVVSNINGVRGLFNQMVPEEISLIRENTFDQLWNYFWGIKTPIISIPIENKNEDKICDNSNIQEISSNNLNIFNKKEYYDSKSKFMILKEKKEIESDLVLDLDFYLNTSSPSYLTPEWGFPKGRKKRGESDIECAIREFSEETDIDESSIEILKNIKPIEEDLTGTNGIRYKHIYYLAELKEENANVISDEVRYSNSEIGDIGFYNYEEASGLIRDYHIEKKSILRCIMNYYMDLIKKNQKNEEEEWVVEADEFQLKVFP